MSMHSTQYTLWHRRFLPTSGCLLADSLAKSNLSLLFFLGAVWDADSLCCKICQSADEWYLASGLALSLVDMESCELGFLAHNSLWCCSCPSTALVYPHCSPKSDHLLLPVPDPGRMSSENLVLQLPKGNRTCGLYKDLSFILWMMIFSSTDISSKKKWSSVWVRK